MDEDGAYLDNPGLGTTTIASTEAATCAALRADIVHYLSLLPDDPPILAAIRTNVAHCCSHLPPVTPSSS